MVMIGWVLESCYVKVSNIPPKPQTDYKTRKIWVIFLIKKKGWGADLHLFSSRTVIMLLLFSIY